tara:strand:- start:1105 stop:2943 length:1839 start_codon:yes stop_codon:yes gene_type:complete
MANGYGGSSSSSSSSGSYSSGEVAGEGFLKIKDGVKAPVGFHYMPDGGLMSDADHIAVNGYVEKTINQITIDQGDVSPDGGSKTISINGTSGFVFSIEIYEGNRASYYNFKTSTWSTANYKHTNIHVPSGVSSLSVNFPTESSLKTYTVNVYAETVENIKTKHTTISEVRNADGNLNLNLSSGSDSNIVTKLIYQDVIKNLYVSAIAPSLYAASTDTVDGAVSSSNRIVIDGDATDQTRLKIGDLVTGTGMLTAVHALVTKINPDNDNTNEIEVGVTDSISDGVTLTFTPPFNGMTPHYTDSTSGRQALEVVSSTTTTLDFSMTITATSGRAFSVKRLPIAEDLCVVKLVTFGAAALPITGEDVSGSTYYRWPITNTAGLSNGMLLDPSRSGTGVNTTSPAIISDYKTTTTLQRLDESRYNTDFSDYTIPDISISGVDTEGNIATTVDRNGLVTARAGNITFNMQQADALKSDANIRIIAQGAKNIKEASGMEVSLSDVVLTPTQVSTTTSGAVSASATIGVTAADNITVGATIRGVGINSAVANPTVVSKAAKTGGVNIVASAVQTLESGATLFFDGPSNIITLTGKIKVKDMPITDQTLYFNVERFLTCL